MAPDDMVGLKVGTLGVGGVWRVVAAEAAALDAKRSPLPSAVFALLGGLPIVEVVVSTSLLKLSSNAKRASVTGA